MDMDIAHASEVLSLDEPGFVHAIGLAARSGATVRGIHIVRSAGSDPPLPAASALLERWRKPADSVDHRWVLATGDEDTADALLRVIEPLRPSLLIASTHARTGWARLLLGSVAEGVARNVGIPVLILPSQGAGLVHAESGAVSLSRVLLLAGRTEDAARAAAGLNLLTKLAGVGPGSVELLHVEDGMPAPQVELPPGYDVSHHRARGPIERAVAERVQRYLPDVVVMTSHGHDALSDIVFSSHTERVLHETRVPLLWVPASRGVRIG